MRGESIFVAKITNYCGRDIPYFDPHFLGDKFPVFDHLVNVVDGTAVDAYFFAQVKTTSAGYETRADGKRYLKTKVSREDLKAMFQYPGPAYLFGIDDDKTNDNANINAYVIAIDKEREAGFSAMPTDFVVDCNTLRELWDEVKAYWADNPAFFQSRFSSK